MFFNESTKVYFKKLTRKIGMKSFALIMIYNVYAVLRVSVPNFGRYKRLISKVD